MIGSYYAVTPQLRDKVKELLDKAREKGAIIYYDVNFRSTHKNEAIKLLPVILENFEYADIIRGSVEDFENMFGLTDADKVLHLTLTVLLLTLLVFMVKHGTN